LLHVAPWVVSRVVSKGIVDHCLGPPRRNECLVRRGDLVPVLVRAAEIALASPREKRFYYFTSPRAVRT
jgi:hypothetical protein